MLLSGHSWHDVAVRPDTDGILVAEGGDLYSAQSEAGLTVTFWGSPQCKHTFKATGPLGAQRQHGMATLASHHPQR